MRVCIQCWMRVCIQWWRVCFGVGCVCSSVMDVCVVQWWMRVYSVLDVCVVQWWMCV